MLIEAIKRFFSNYNSHNEENNTSDDNEKFSLLDLPEDSENLDEIDKEIMDIGFIEEDDEWLHYIKKMQQK